MEPALASAASCAAHDYALIGSASGGAHGMAFGPHHTRGGGDFRDGFTAGPQRHQQPAHLAGRGRAFKQSLERQFGLGAGQRPVGGKADQRAQIVAHAGTANGTFAVSRNVRNNLCPCSEAIDSG